MGNPYVKAVLFEPTSHLTKGLWKVRAFLPPPHSSTASGDPRPDSVAMHQYHRWLVEGWGWRGRLCEILPRRTWWHAHRARGWREDVVTIFVNLSWRATLIPLAHQSDSLYQLLEEGQQRCPGLAEELRQVGQQESFDQVATALEAEGLQRQASLFSG